MLIDALIAMIDPTLCLETPGSSWASLSWKVFQWLATPTLVLPSLIALITLPWLFRLPRRRLVSGLGMVLLTLYLASSSPSAIAVGNRLLVSFLPSDSGATADAIVVLGRGAPLRPQRVEVASQLWQEQRAPLVFASGWSDAVPIGQLLERQGVPLAAIDGEPCSRTTEENALFTSTILQPQGVRRILLVTDPPHMLRSLLTFRSLGFEVIPHPNPLPERIDAREKGFLVFREYPGLVSYGLKGRFSRRDAPADLPIRHASLSIDS